MMLFYPEVDPNIKGWNMAGRHGRGREIGGMLPGDQRRFTSPHKLK
jgi:hypothetical protein